LFRCRRWTVSSGHAVRVREKPDGKILYNLNDLCAALGETSEWGIEQAEKLGPEFYERIVTEP
jgi:hypothetical protein